MTFRDIWRAAGPLAWITVVLLPLIAGVAALLVFTDSAAYRATTTVKMPVTVGIAAPWMISQRADDLRATVKSDEFGTALLEAVPDATEAERRSGRVETEGLAGEATITLAGGTAERTEKLAQAAGRIALEQVVVGLRVPQEALVESLNGDLKAARIEFAAVTAPAEDEAPSQEYVLAAAKVEDLAFDARREALNLRGIDVYSELASAGKLTAVAPAVAANAGASRLQLALGAVIGGLVLGLALTFLLGAVRLRGRGAPAVPVAPPAGYVVPPVPGGPAPRGATSAAPGLDWLAQDDEEPGSDGWREERDARRARASRDRG